MGQSLRNTGSIHHRTWVLYGTRKRRVREKSFENQIVNLSSKHQYQTRSISYCHFVSLSF